MRGFGSGDAGEGDWKAATGGGGGGGGGGLVGAGLEGAALLGCVGGINDIPVHNKKSNKQVGR